VGHARRLLATTAVVALAATACAVGDSSDDSADSGRTVVTFRLWDEQVAKAYEKSFAAFEKEHPDIDVQIQLVPWADYWTKLPADISSGTVADIFWTNTSNFGIYADSGALIDVGAELGDQQKDWKQSVVELYTRNGKLWGVPQLWDSIALFYNKKLLEEADIDPTTLHWDPDPAKDTFLPAAKKLTMDAAGKRADEPGFDPTKIQQYGFNAALDPQGIYWNFVGSNGGIWQDGDAFDLDRPETVAAIEYVVDLINEHHVAPPAADTVNNGDRTRDLFVQGRMALFQSGPYHLKTIQEQADFEWGVAPMLEGPKGRIGVVHGVAAVASSATKHREETLEVLRWLGSAEGQRPIAEGGYAFPGVTSVEQAYVDYWTKQGVDLEAFLQSASGETFPAPVGPRVNAGATAMDPILKEIFLGRRPVAEGLAEAERVGNAALEQ